jgi:hypothetical protein
LASSTLIGKSFFLYFLLIERILAGQPTAWQFRSSDVILIHNHNKIQMFPENVWLDTQAPEYSGYWALVDSNAQVVQPRGEFTDTHSKFYLVQAASPQPARWKAWKKYLSASIAVMKPWSWDEIYIGGSASSW